MIAHILIPRFARAFGASRAAGLVAALLVSAAADGQTGVWTLRTPTASPVGISWHAMAYDPIRRETVVFGGRTGTSGYSGFQSNTWTYNGTTWTLKATSGPSPRSNVVMAFDSARGVLVLFGGFDGSPLGDTWEWNGAAWTQRFPSGPIPPPRSDMGLAYDSGRGVTVLHGGFGVQRFADTWEWNGTTWTQGPSTVGSDGDSTSMAFDSSRGVVVLFDGAAGKTLEYNGVSWTLRSTSGPSRREYAPLAYDPYRRVCVLSGGNNFGPSVSGTFEWNGSAWVPLTVGGPGAWQGHKLAFDTERGELVWFGGEGSNQTWVMPTFAGPSSRWVQFGDADLLGFGGYASLPMAGAAPAGLGAGSVRQATSAFGHSFPFAPSATDFPGTDQIYVGSAQSGAFDGYAGSGFRRAGPQVFTLDYSAILPPGQAAGTLTLGIAADDFQFPAFGQAYVATVNGQSFPALTSALNALSQTGPQTRFLSVGLPVSMVNASRTLTLAIDQQGGGDGWAIDFLTVGVTDGPATDAVPFNLAGPNDNAVATGTRPDPGAGSTATYTFNTLTVDNGGSFTLGSGETLNAPNGIVVQPGGVLIANGTINGNLINRGLVIIPITQAGLVSRITGPGRVIIPLPTPTPGLPPPQPPIIPFPTPPSIDPGQFFDFRGGGPGAGSPGSGGSGGGWVPGGGSVKIITPAITFPGPVKLDAKLEVTGDVTQTETGLMRFYIAGNTRGETYSTLECGKSIALAGGLQVVLRPELLGYLPRVGDSFDLMTSQDGITLSTGSINLTTMMTLAGAQQLGITLPAYASPYAGDPDSLVVFPSSLFSYSIVDAGKTLRATLIAPICGPTTPAASATACPSGSAAFSVTPNGSGPFTFRWQVQSAAGAWVELGTTPIAIPCPTGGSALASATAPTSQSTRIAIVPCPSGPGVTLNRQVFQVRGVVSSDCGDAPAPPSAYSVCVGDFDCSGQRTIDDIFIFLSAWFANDPRSDIDAQSGRTIDDIFLFLSIWFAGC